MNGRGLRRPKQTYFGTKRHVIRIPLRAVLWRRVSVYNHFHPPPPPRLLNCTIMSMSVDDLVASLSGSHIGQEAMDLATLQVRLV
jgi:hypothetical protein